MQGDWTARALLGEADKQRSQGRRDLVSKGLNSEENVRRISA